MASAASFLVAGSEGEVARLLAEPLIVLIEHNLKRAAKSFDFIPIWWWEKSDAGFVLVNQTGSSPKDMRTPLLNLPHNVLAILGSRAEAAKELADIWSLRTGNAAPPISGGDPEEILLALTRASASALLASRKLHADALLALSRTRIDFEETREAMFQLEKTLGARPPAVPRVRLQIVSGKETAVVPNSERHLHLEQSLETTVRGLAGIELLVTERGTGECSALAVRLIAAESETLLGSWFVPGESAAAGWLRLLCPTPINMRDETAILDVTLIAGEAGTSPAIKLDQHQQASGWTLLRNGQACSASLCFRALEAAIGSFRIAPDYWIWKDSHRSLVRRSSASWLLFDSARSRVLAGEGRIAFESGTATFQFMIENDTPLALAIDLPAAFPCGTVVAHFASLERTPSIEVGVSVRTAAEGGPLADEPLSGWKQMPEYGECSVGLELPLRMRSCDGQVIIHVRARLASNLLAYIVELDGIQLFDLADDAATASCVPAAKDYAKTPIGTPLAGPVSPEELPRIRIQNIRILDHLVKPDQDYEHFQVVLELAQPPRSKTDFCFKLAKSQDRFSAELREADVGHIFPDGLWNESDNFGRLFILHPHQAAIADFVRVAEEQAAALVLNALMQLPKVVERIALQQPADGREHAYEFWSTGVDLFVKAIQQWAASSDSAKVAGPAVTGSVGL